MFTRFVMTPASFGASKGTFSLGEIARLLARAQAAHVSRRELAELDPRLLRDIGMTDGQATIEARRSAWDLEPPTRRRHEPDRQSLVETRITGWAEALRTAIRRRRTRQSIAGLDSHALRDIGVTFAEAENEANKPLWRR
jgi:uncharacterized protein YjiS (DUF1127 family)